MNRKIVFYMLGQILKLEAAIMILPLLCALIYREWNGAVSFLITIGIALVLGFGLTLLNKTKNRTFFAKEGFVIVALSWIIISAVGAIPFVISGEIPNYINAFFETVSGFTTTGSSILTDVESMSHGMLFWRSGTHWVGGMGVLVLIVAILPTDSGRTMHILRAEMPGPVAGKITPKLRTMTKTLYFIYAGFTLLEIGFLFLGGMSVFDSIVHSLGTAGTGGFGIKADGLASYSPYCQWVITIFMLIFGVNFNLYYLILFGRIKTALKSEELWTYIGIFGVASTLITVNILNTAENLGEAIRLSTFQVSSIMTTTGYATADFNLWPNLSKGILLLLMFSGACAGSTAGGFKISRLVILFKKITKSIKQLIHPRATTSISFEGKTTDSETINGILIYLAVYCLCFIIIFFLLLFEPFDIETNLSAAASCFNNIGPGLSAVGPAANFNEYSYFAKLVLSAAMLLGRLEILPMLVLFSPSVWIKKRAKS